MALEEYRQKRHFEDTPEPPPAAKKGPALVAGHAPRRFCVQQHRASHMHWDFRLEMDGVLKSWAVPKGPTLDPEIKRLAMMVEDHPLDYMTFEGVIPEGNYGAGEVIVWDLGTYRVVGDTPAVAQLERGNLKFIMQGKKLRGEFVLARMGGRRPGSKGNEWLLIKKHDDAATIGYTAEQQPRSVLSGKTVTQMAGAGSEGEAASWQSNRSAARRAKQPAVIRKAAAQRREAALRAARAAARQPSARPAAAKVKRAARAAANRRIKAAPAAPEDITDSQPEVAAPPPKSPARASVRRAAAQRSQVAELAELPGAVRAAMPRDLRPMLATLGRRPFSDPNWLFEIKWDGIRALAFIEPNDIRFVSRNGNDLTFQYPELHQLRTRFGLKQGIVDGEIVVLDAAGRSSFNRLQQRMNLSGADDIERAMKKYPAVYYCFDLPYAEGYQLLRTPLIDRKEALRARLQPDERVRFSDHVIGDGLGLFEVARSQELEGIVAKDLHCAYEAKRSRRWIKLKTVRQQEAVVVGYTEPQGERKYFGSLLLGVYDKAGKKLEYVGHVGTGFDRLTLKRLFEQLKPLETSEPPVTGGPARGKAHWVKPRLVVEVKFAEWTPDRKMRVPVFLGVRTDKEPAEVVREI